MGTNVHVVVTTVNDGERDLFADVVLVTDDEALAELTYNKLKNREPIEGLDYSFLSNWDDVAYFTRPLNSLACWGGNHVEG